MWQQSNHKIDEAHIATGVCMVQEGSWCTQTRRDARSEVQKMLQCFLALTVVTTRGSCPPHDCFATVRLRDLIVW